MFSKLVALERPAFETRMSSRSPTKLRNMRRQSMRTIGHRQIGGNRIGPALSFANLIDHGICFTSIASVMHDDSRACGGKS
jgi:hypothetical protein